jgi:hypothetical protein
VLIISSILPGNHNQMVKSFTEPYLQINALSSVVRRCRRICGLNELNQGTERPMLFKIVNV